MDETTFKLFPLQLIHRSGYELAASRERDSLVSPEMIIALRCGEGRLDDELYLKSNVFVLGLIMLECACLQPSLECYERDTLDILDKVIRERLEMCRQFYS